MSFTYGGDPSASSLAKVRFLIQDTDSTDVLLQDAEINWIISESADVYQASSNACYVIASKFSRQSDYSKSVGDLSVSESAGNRAQTYMALGDSMLVMSTRKNSPIASVNPQAIVNTADRLVSQYTTEFWEGQMDNNL
jgi:hypothetical protein